MLDIQGDDVGQRGITACRGSGCSARSGQELSEISFKLLAITRRRIFWADAMKASAAEHDGSVTATGLLVDPGGHGLYSLSHSLHSVRSYRLPRPTGVQGMPSSSRRRKVDSDICRAAQSCCRVRSVILENPCQSLAPVCRSALRSSSTTADEAFLLNVRVSALHPLLPLLPLLPISICAGRR